MARKNPFANLMADDAGKQGPEPVLSYAAKGASKSFLSSINEIASRADKLLEGEQIVELDPAVVDGSFIRDRLDQDGPEFEELLNAIRERGQDTPILVRPHPRSAGRYMVVFGHRRLKAAAALERKVRAVVRPLADAEHVVAQGQENSARANLSFIEKALYAAELVRLRYDQDNSIVLAALSVDRASLSKMLSVAAIGAPILSAIGAAKGIGRDRWYELKLLLDNPTIQARAESLTATPDFEALGSDERFDLLLRRLKSGSAARPRVGSQPYKWAASDGALTAELITDRSKVTVAFRAKAPEVKAFSEFLSGNLDSLYEAFKRGQIPLSNGEL